MAAPPPKKLKMYIIIRKRKNYILEGIKDYDKRNYDNS